jgi:hypothetical protein
MPDIGRIGRCVFGKAAVDGMSSGHFRAGIVRGAAGHYESTRTGRKSSSIKAVWLCTFLRQELVNVELVKPTPRSFIFAVQPRPRPSSLDE